MSLSSRRMLIPVVAAVLLLANCVPAAPSTQDPVLVEQMIEQSVALTLAAENAQAKDQQLIEQAVALTVAAQNARATEQQAAVAALTPSPTAESVALPGGVVLTSPAAEIVTLPGGSDSTTAVDPSAPVIDKIDPPEGPTRGGTVVTISGQNFGKGTDIQFLFGENPATNVVCEEGIKCTAVTPPGKEGIVLVRAVHGDRQSQHVEGNPFDGFKYKGPPKYGCDVLTTAPKNLAVFKSGQSFAVKWIVKNSGKNSWPPGMDVKFSNGVNMGNQARLEIPDAMKPGDTYAIKLDAKAPTNPGTYYMTWIVEGMGCSAYVAIVVE